jgi:hypothetical protein
LQVGGAFGVVSQNDVGLGDALGDAREIADQPLGPEMRVAIGMKRASLLVVTLASPTT